LYCYEARRQGWLTMWVKPVYLWHQHQGSGFRQAWRTKDTKTFNRLK